MSNNLEELVESYYDKMIPLLISDFELSTNYDEEYGKDLTDEELETAVKKDIMHDFKNNIKNIQFDFDILDYSDDSAEMQQALEVYKQIKKYFPDFKSKRMEEIKI